MGSIAGQTSDPLEIMQSDQIEKIDGIFFQRECLQISQVICKIPANDLKFRDLSQKYGLIYVVAQLTG